MRYLLLVCLVVSLSPLRLSAGDGDDQRIRAAIHRGVQFLKQSQQSDGSWPYPGHAVGITSLAGLALAENGHSLEDASLKNAYEFVRTSAPGETQTYDIALAILLLSRVGAEQDQELIQQLGSALVAGQLSTGGWSYVCPGVPAGPVAQLSNAGRNKPEAVRRTGRIAAGGRAKQGGFGDNSNTQLAVLGLWAAGRAGLDVRDAMTEVDRRFRGSQSPRGGWGYKAGGDSDAMTCAGLLALVLAKGQKTLENQVVNAKPAAAPEGPGGRAKMASDALIEKGIKRVEQYAAGTGPASTLYYLWSLERVCVAMGLSRLGNVDWYERGATLLLQNQHTDGSWSSNRGALADTSFALLFLRRSNLAKGMPQLMTGRGASDSGNRMRAGSLEDLLRTVRPARDADAAPPDPAPR